MKIIFVITVILSQIGFLGVRHEAYVPRHTNVVLVAGEYCPLSTIDYRLRPTVALHAYHISNFEMEYNAETKALEIIAKIFIDDLEEGIAASGVDENLYLCTDREVDGSDEYIYGYLSSKINIKIDGQEVSFGYIGKETSEDLVAMYCYLEVENIEPINEITISNDMLMELFDDQINIIKLKSKSTGKRGFMMLKKGQHSDTVQLQ